MDKENITINGFRNHYGIRISTPETPSYTFRFLSLKDTDEVRLKRHHRDTEANIIHFIILYMKHCSQECTHVPEKEELRFDYNES